MTTRSLNNHQMLATIIIIAQHVMSGIKGMKNGRQLITTLSKTQGTIHTTPVAIIMVAGITTPVAIIMVAGITIIKDIQATHPVGKGDTSTVATSTRDTSTVATSTRGTSMMGIIMSMMGIIMSMTWARWVWVETERPWFQSPTRSSPSAFRTQVVQIWVIITFPA